MGSDQSSFGLLYRTARGGANGRMGAPQVIFETVVVTRPLKVIAFTCCVITCIILVAATSTADWMLAEGWREGLFQQCISEGAALPLPFEMTPEVGCRSARTAGYLGACAALVIIGLITDFFGTVMTALGLRSTDPNKKYKYYKVAIYALLAALVALLLAAIIYPVSFSKELAQEPDKSGFTLEAGSIDFDKDGVIDLLDEDNDGIPDDEDNENTDNDGDGIPDEKDDDDDNDGTPDEEDNDDDGDGVDDADDGDDDNDGIPDSLEEDSDGDGVPDEIDPDDGVEDDDFDNDGIPDHQDNDDDGDGIADDEDNDNDNDGTPDDEDADDDNDGVPDDKDDDNEAVSAEDDDEDDDDEDNDSNEDGDGSNEEDDEEEDDGKGPRTYTFGFGYGAVWGCIILIFASVVLIATDRENEEIFYKEK